MGFARLNPSYAVLARSIDELEEQARAVNKARARPVAVSDAGIPAR